MSSTASPRIKTEKCWCRHGAALPVHSCKHSYTELSTLSSIHAHNVQTYVGDSRF